VYHGWSEGDLLTGKQKKTAILLSLDKKNKPFLYMLDPRGCKKNGVTVDFCPTPPANWKGQCLQPSSACGSTVRAAFEEALIR
jgi:hypothetical protein